MIWARFRSIVGLWRRIIGDAVQQPIKNELKYYMYGIYVCMHVHMYIGI